jgi:hypothetical protein
MARIRNRSVPAEEAAPWDGPFAPPAPRGPVRLNPMVKTAAQLAGQDDVAAPAASVAAA